MIDLGLEGDLGRLEWIIRGEMNFHVEHSTRKWAIRLFEVMHPFQRRKDGKKIQDRIFGPPNGSCRHHLLDQLNSSLVGPSLNPLVPITRDERMLKGKQYLG